MNRRTLMQFLFAAPTMAKGALEGVQMDTAVTSAGIAPQSDSGMQKGEPARVGLMNDVLKRKIETSSRYKNANRRTNGNPRQFPYYVSNKKSWSTAFKHHVWVNQMDKDNEILQLFNEVRYGYSDHIGAVALKRLLKLLEISDAQT